MKCKVRIKVQSDFGKTFKGSNAQVGDTDGKLMIHVSEAGREQEVRPPGHQDSRRLDLDLQEKGSRGWGRQTQSPECLWLSGAAGVKGTAVSTGQLRSSWKAPEWCCQAGGD